MTITFTGKPPKIGKKISWNGSVYKLVTLKGKKGQIEKQKKK